MHVRKINLTTADPRGAALARLDISSGEVKDFFIPAGFSGIHQTFSPDGSFLVSDGGGGETGPGKYISKLTLQTDGSVVFKGEHLVTLQANDYKKIEPNPHVSPDNRWVMFTAMLHGTPQAYGVEMDKKYKSNCCSETGAVDHRFLR